MNEILKRATADSCLSSCRACKFPDRIFSNTGSCVPHALVPAWASVSWGCRRLSGLLPRGRKEIAELGPTTACGRVDSTTRPPLNGGLSSRRAEGMMPAQSRLVGKSRRHARPAVRQGSRMVSGRPVWLVSGRPATGVMRQRNIDIHSIRTSNCCSRATLGSTDRGSK